MYRILLALVVGILVGACTGLEPGDRVLETHHGIKIYSQHKALVPVYFLESIENYTAELSDALSLENEVRLALGQLEVIFEPFDPHVSWVGKFVPSNQVIIMVNDRSSEISIFGHEMVRYVEFLKDNDHWRQSSHSWHGEMGEYWNIAETLSLPFAKLE